MRIKPVIKLFLGGVFVIFGMLFVTGYFRLEPIQNSETFASEPIEISGFDPSNVQEGSIPQKLIIPSLDVYLNVRQADIINGYWEVFEEYAGWGMGSGIPGQPGNQVIFAHARDGLFAPLRKIENGMRILVLTQDSWYEYEVVQIDEVYPGNTKYIQQTEEEILTLYTCSGYQDSKRLIVVAKPI